MIRRALIFSDTHFGWTVCSAAHRELLAALPAAADDAELVILNGDITDVHRGLPRAEERELVAQLEALCAQWRREGRQVVRIEGNHDRDASPIWNYTFEGAHGERVLVLHGHRFSDEAFAPGPYEHFGRHVLTVENYALARARVLRATYGLGWGWFVGAWGLAEDRLWRPPFPGRVAPLLDGYDVLVHGHFHFGAGRTEIAGRPAWKSGAWVSRGHLGTVDRMLRYRDGRWERIALARGTWRATDDGR
jgi:UDP-2,3-diacylglucosamine pyrophosphatase LpxH